MSEIPLASRIIAITEAYDYMVHHDGSEPPLPARDAVEEILRNAGSQFDPQLADLFASISS
jgi:HD-GYP domain-containing protein (c-di-GMP phosphodiesterase class II)